MHENKFGINKQVGGFESIKTRLQDQYSNQFTTVLP